ncbi:unnamed protein product [Kluyveromyces dobzhanskii CBS 2104]|uniref:Autophagy-related protein 20 n=1 Tax=Kluyveromyces dobzhanskii CBS 2104 TaxID=1427455 RepID=A0A0A8L910_9SACH|nr:unnamed protein product [Kluyveromyces dobzhanskii CBS 2104]
MSKSEHHSNNKSLSESGNGKPAEENEEHGTSLEKQKEMRRNSNKSPKGSGSREQNGVHAQGDVIHTQIIQQDNPFVNYMQDNGESGENGRDNDEDDNKDTGSDDNEDQLLQPNRGVSNKERRRSSVATSKDSSPDVPYNTLHHNLNAMNQDGKKRAQILEASKVSEGQGRTYIAYAIKYGGLIVKRRYSDFESLRKVLIKLFPMTLIPPIPEKQSLKSYGKAMAHSKTSYLLPTESGDSVDLSLSVINGPVTTNDEKLIRHRIRMLTSFLNRLLKNKEITKTSIVYDFLDPNNKNWNDLITSSLTISSLPKSVLQCNPIDPTNTTKAHSYLPVPSSSTQLLATKETHSASDADEFSKIEEEYRNYEQLIHSGLYKYSRATTKEFNNLREDLKGISSEFAQLSTDETKTENGLAELLSHSSDAYGAIQENMETLVGNLHYNISEPLSECAHMATAVRELIHYRRLKLLQKDILERTILYKRGQLVKFKQQENDHKQIDNMVNKELGTSGVVILENPAGTQSYSGKFMNRFSQLASIIKDSVSYQEQDPATAARSLEKELTQLEETLKVATSDLAVISETLKNTELPIFIKERNEELTQIFKNYAKYMKENATRNLEAWKELQSRTQET